MPIKKHSVTLKSSSSIQRPQLMDQEPKPEHKTRNLHRWGIPRPILTSTGEQERYRLESGLTVGEERQLMLRMEELARIEGLRNDKIRAKIPSTTSALIDSKAADREVLKHDGSVPLSADWDIGNGRRIRADEIAARNINGLKLSDNGENGIFVKDGGYVGIGTTSPGGLLGLSDSDTYLDVDANGNLTFTDTNAGTRTLKNLGCPTYVFIKAVGQSEGDLHLFDATNWGVSKAIIKLIRVATSSTDWDLYLLQNDNGHAVDNANIPELQIVKAGDGNVDVHLDLLSG